MTTEFISVVILLGIFIGFVEIVKRKFAIRSDTSRKIAHTGAALIAALTPLFLNKWEIIIIGLGGAGFLYFTRRTIVLSSIHSVDRQTMGEVFFPIGVATCAYLFLPEHRIAFQFGILVMGISDALAALIGEKFGKYTFTVFGGKKSAEGSFAFFLSCLVLLYFFVPNLSQQSALIAVVLTVAEVLLTFGLDNLVIPVLGAYLIQFLL